MKQIIEKKLTGSCRNEKEFNPRPNVEKTFHWVGRTLRTQNYLKPKVQKTRSPVLYRTVELRGRKVKVGSHLSNRFSKYQQLWRNFCEPANYSLLRNNRRGRVWVSTAPDPGIQNRFQGFSIVYYIYLNRQILIDLSEKKIYVINIFSNVLSGI